MIMKYFHTFLIIISAALLVYEICLLLLYKKVSLSYFMIALSLVLLMYAFLALKGVLPVLLQRIISSMIVVFLVSFVVITFQVITTGMQRDTSSCDQLLILGAQVEGDSPSASLKYRLDASLEYLELYPDTTVIVSGGKGDGEDISEARCMADYLMDHGIDEDQIILEDQSTSTQENLEYSQKYFQGNKTIVISNSFHMYRVKKIAESLDIPISCYGASSHLITCVHFVIREYFALLKQFIV